MEAGPVIAAVEREVFCPDFRPEWELKDPLRLSVLDYFYEAIASPLL